MNENKPLFDLTDYFSQRKAVSDDLKEDIRSLRVRFKKEEKTAILFSLQLQGTVIHLGKDIQKVFNHEYPEDGLLLLTVEIVNISVVNNKELSFNNYLELRFKMSDKNWNGSIPLPNSFCYDQGLKIADNSVGCYEPTFKSQQKYLEVKNFIHSAKKQLREYY